jgi:acetoin utilization deacetylase AcuC-like enzyme
MTTGFVWHEKYMWWDSRGYMSGLQPWFEPIESGESVATKRRFKNLLDVSGLTEQLVAIKPRMATEDEIARLHTREYMARMKELSDAFGGDAGEGTPFGSGGYEIALLATGGCIAAVDAVLDGQCANAYALVRPPGHHAEAGRGRGYCMFGNTALAAMHARQARGLARVATVDWDVHHGNGTQDAFYNDPSVLTISLHQDRLYPTNSGSIEEIGAGDGVGYNINIPLPPGTASGGYVAAFERVVAPALRRFQPELILIASGLDASAFDPSARMMLHSEGYREMTRILMEVAAECCSGRLVACHEGGYSPHYVPFCGLAVVEQLSGICTEVEDTLGAYVMLNAGNELQPHQDAVIRRVEANLERLGG